MKSNLIQLFGSVGLTRPKLKSIHTLMTLWSLSSKHVSSDGSTKFSWKLKIEAISIRVSLNLLIKCLIVILRYT